jgi:LEA14-like dessication related protein
MKAFYSLLFVALIAIGFASCGTANVKEPEYREIREVKLIEIGVLQSKAGIDLVYYNPNNFGVQLAEARGDVYIDNVYFGRFGLDQAVQVKKRSEFIVPAVVSMDMIGAVRNQRDLLKKKEVLVRVEGVAKVRKAGISRDIPLKYEGMQNIERLRSLIAP